MDKYMYPSIKACIHAEYKIYLLTIAVAGVAQDNPSIIPAKQILSMATKNSYRQPHLYPTGNLVNTLLECVTAADVCDMAVDGQILMQNREVLTLDEERILAVASVLIAGALFYFAS